MMTKNQTKKALLASIMSMVLCLAMLFGTTLAWFTDTATNDTNRITTGTLDVQLLKYVDTGYADISGDKGNIFNDGTVTEGENLATATLWEPNKTEVVLLQVKNAGKLALDYNINLVITPDASTKTESLSEVMQYAIISGFDASAHRGNAGEGESVLQSAILTNAGITSWENIIGYAGVETAALPTEPVTAAPNGALEPEESNYFLLAVHMDKNAGNAYQDMGLTIDVSVDAKQQDSEADSFGTEYDKDALWVEGFLNRNLLKDSGFDTGLVSDSAKGWMLYDHDKDGDVTPADNGTIQINEADENKYLEISYKDYLSVVDNTVSATHDCNLDNSAELVVPHDVITGVYQTVDLSEYPEVIENFKDYQFEISAKSRVVSIFDKLRIYFEYLDDQGNVLNTSGSTAYMPGKQICEYTPTSQNDWEGMNTIVSGSDVPANTAKINVCFALRVKSNQHYKNLGFALNLDDVQFKITKSTTTE